MSGPTTVALAQARSRTHDKMQPNEPARSSLVFHGVNGELYIDLGYDWTARGAPRRVELVGGISCSNSHGLVAQLRQARETAISAGEGGLANLIDSKIKEVQTMAVLDSTQAELDRVQDERMALRATLIEQQERIKYLQGEVVAMAAEAIDSTPVFETPTAKPKKFRQHLGYTIDSPCIDLANDEL